MEYSPSFCGLKVCFIVAWVTYLNAHEFQSRDVHNIWMVTQKGNLMRWIQVLKIRSCCPSKITQYVTQRPTKLIESRLSRSRSNIICTAHMPYGNKLNCPPVYFSLRYLFWVFPSSSHFRNNFFPFSSLFASTSSTRVVCDCAYVFLFLSLPICLVLFVAHLLHYHRFVCMCFFRNFCAFVSSNLLWVLLLLRLCFELFFVSVTFASRFYFVWYTMAWWMLMLMLMLTCAYDSACVCVCVHVRMSFFVKCFICNSYIFCLIYSYMCVCGRTRTQVYWVYTIFDLVTSLICL